MFCSTGVNFRPSYIVLFLVYLGASSAALSLIFSCIWILFLFLLVVHPHTTLACVNMGRSTLLVILSFIYSAILLRLPIRGSNYFFAVFTLFICCFEWSYLWFWVTPRYFTLFDQLTECPAIRISAFSPRFLVPPIRKACVFWELIFIFHFLEYIISFSLALCSLHLTHVPVFCCICSVICILRCHYSVCLCSFRGIHHEQCWWSSPALTDRGIDLVSFVFT